MRLLAILLLLAPLAATAQPDDPPLDDPPPVLDIVLADGLSIHFREASMAAPGAPPAEACDTWYGTDGGAPEDYIQAGFVEMDGRHIDLDVSCMTSCEFCGYEDALTVTPIAGTADVEISGTLSDGAGTYYVTWRVGPYGSARTRLVAFWQLHQEPADPTSALRRQLLDAYGIVVGMLDEGTGDAARLDELRGVLEALDEGLGALQARRTGGR